MATKFDIGAVFEQLVSGYMRLPLAQKIAIPLLVAASTGVIVFVARWGARPDYGVLYSGLEESDSAAVIEALKNKKIGFRLRDEGKTVEIIPADSVHQVRLELASAGIPKGGKVGFEIFSETSIGRTRFAEELLGIQALQGELERTIKGISAVRNVRVHITKPKRSVFAKKDVPPTASVLLQLKIGEELSKEQIKGVANLVAGAVEGLEAQNVTILDERGRTLNRGNEGEGNSDGELPRFDYQRRYETTLATQIESMLSEVLGPGRAVARVTAELDFSKREREEESFDPGGAVVLSERLVEDAGGIAADGGVPGVTSNLTNDRGILTPPTTTGGSQGSRKETSRNYQLSRARNVMIGATGTVRRLSVAVLVDGQYHSPNSGVSGVSAQADGKKVYEPLKPEMISKIESLVKQTVGFDSARGDTVSIENMQFFEPDESIGQILASAEARGLVSDYAPYAVQVIAVLLFFTMLVRPMIKNLVSPSEAEVDLSRLLPAGVSELEAELEAERTRTSVMPEPMEPIIDIEELEKLISSNSKIVKDNPQQAALLIRYWLNEGRM